MKKGFRKFTSWITLCCFVLGQTGFEKAGWAGPELSVGSSEVGAIHELPLQFNIPPALGTVESIHSGTGPTLIHIQEAHGNVEGQKKIQAILHHLKDAYGFKLILLEGNAFKLEPGLLQFYPEDPERNRKILERLRDEGLLTGPELFLAENGFWGLTPTELGSDPRRTRSAPTAYGIEDVRAYVENGRRLKEAVEQQEKASAFLRRLDTEIEKRSNENLSPELRRFLKRGENRDVGAGFPRTKYNGSAAQGEGTSPLQSLPYLKEMARKHLQIDLTHPAYQIDWPMLVRMFTLQRIEKKLDLGKFEKERKAFLRAVRSLMVGAGFPRPVAKTLGAETAPLQLFDQIDAFLSLPPSHHALPAPETTLLVEEMVARLPKNFGYAAYPNVNRFIGHLILESELKADRLMEEIEKLTDQIVDRLAKSPKEKEIVRLLKDYRLLKKLLALELTAGEYDRIVGADPRVRPPLTWFGTTGSVRTPKNIPDRISQSKEHPWVRPFVVDGDLLNGPRDTHGPTHGSAPTAQALAFYHAARKRDRFMLENIEKRLRETGETKAVVITGGFHTEPFKKYFQEKNYSYALITPKISLEGRGHSDYLKSVSESLLDPKSARLSAYRPVEAGTTRSENRILLGQNPLPSDLRTARLLFYEGRGRGESPVAIRQRISGMPRFLPYQKRRMIFDPKRGFIPARRSEARSTPEDPGEPSELDKLGAEIDELDHEMRRLEMNIQNTKIHVFYPLEGDVKDAMIQAVWGLEGNADLKGRAVRLRIVPGSLSQRVRLLLMFKVQQISMADVGVARQAQAALRSILLRGGVEALTYNDETKISNVEKRASLKIKFKQKETIFEGVSVSQLEFIYNPGKKRLSEKAEALIRNLSDSKISQNEEYIDSFLLSLFNSVNLDLITQSPLGFALTEEESLEKFKLHFGWTLDAGLVSEAEFASWESGLEQKKREKEAKEERLAEIGRALQAAKLRAQRQVELARVGSEQAEQVIFEHQEQRGRRLRQQRQQDSEERKRQAQREKVRRTSIAAGIAALLAGVVYAAVYLVLNFQISETEARVRAAEEKLVQAQTRKQEMLAAPYRTNSVFAVFGQYPFPFAADEAYRLFRAQFDPLMRLKALGDQAAVVMDLSPYTIDHIFELEPSLKTKWLNSGIIDQKRFLFQYGDELEAVADRVNKEGMEKSTGDNLRILLLWFQRESPSLYMRQLAGPLRDPKLLVIPKGQPGRLWRAKEEEEAWRSEITVLLNAGKRPRATPSEFYELMINKIREYGTKAAQMYQLEADLLYERLRQVFAQVREQRGTGQSDIKLILPLAGHDPWMLESLQEKALKDSSEFGQWFRRIAVSGTVLAQPDSLTKELMQQHQEGKISDATAILVYLRIALRQMHTLAVLGQPAQKAISYQELETEMKRMLDSARNFPGGPVRLFQNLTSIARIPNIGDLLQIYRDLHRLEVIPSDIWRDRFDQMEQELRPRGDRLPPSFRPLRSEVRIQALSHEDFFRALEEWTSHPDRVRGEVIERQRGLKRNDAKEIQWMGGKRVSGFRSAVWIEDIDSLQLNYRPQNVASQKENATIAFYRDKVKIIVTPSDGIPIPHAYNKADAAAGFVNAGFGKEDGLFRVVVRKGPHDWIKSAFGPKFPGEQFPKYLSWIVSEEDTAQIDQIVLMDPETMQNLPRPEPSGDSGEPQKPSKSPAGNGTAVHRPVVDRSYQNIEALVPVTGDEAAEILKWIQSLSEAPTSPRSMSRELRQAIQVYLHMLLSDGKLETYRRPPAVVKVSKSFRLLIPAYEKFLQDWRARTSLNIPTSQHLQYILKTAQEVLRAEGLLAANHNLLGEKIRKAGVRNPRAEEPAAVLKSEMRSEASPSSSEAGPDWKGLVEVIRMKARPAIAFEVAVHLELLQLENKIPKDLDFLAFSKASDKLAIQHKSRTANISHLYASVQDLVEGNAAPDKVDQALLRIARLIVKETRDGRFLEKYGMEKMTLEDVLTLKLEGENRMEDVLAILEGLKEAGLIFGQLRFEKGKTRGDSISITRTLSFRKEEAPYDDPAQISQAIGELSLLKESNANPGKNVWKAPQPYLIVAAFLIFVLLNWLVTRFQSKQNPTPPPQASEKANVTQISRRGGEAMTIGEDQIRLGVRAVDSRTRNIDMVLLTRQSPVTLFRSNQNPQPVPKEHRVEIQDLVTGDWIAVKDNAGTWAQFYVKQIPPEEGRVVLEVVSALNVKVCTKEEYEHLHPQAPPGPSGSIGPKGRRLRPDRAGGRSEIRIDPAFFAKMEPGKIALWSIGAFVIVLAIFVIAREVWRRVDPIGWILSWTKDPEKQAEKLSRLEGKPEFDTILRNALSERHPKQSVFLRSLILRVKRIKEDAVQENRFDKIVNTLTGMAQHQANPELRKKFIESLAELNLAQDTRQGQKVVKGLLDILESGEVTQRELAVFEEVEKALEKLKVDPKQIRKAHADAVMSEEVPDQRRQAVFEHMGRMYKNVGSDYGPLLDQLTSFILAGVGGGGKKEFVKKHTNKYVIIFRRVVPRVWDQTHSAGIKDAVKQFKGQERNLENEPAIEAAEQAWKYMAQLRSEVRDAAEEWVTELWQTFTRFRDAYEENWEELGRSNPFEDLLVKIRELAEAVSEIDGEDRRRLNGILQKELAREAQRQVRNRLDKGSFGLDTPSLLQAPSEDAFAELKEMLDELGHFASRLFEDISKPIGRKGLSSYQAVHRLRDHLTSLSSQMEKVRTDLLNSAEALKESGSPASPSRRSEARGKLDRKGKQGRGKRTKNFWQNERFIFALVSLGILGVFAHEPILRGISNIPAIRNRLDPKNPANRAGSRIHLFFPPHPDATIFRSLEPDFRKAIDHQINKGRKVVFFTDFTPNLKKDLPAFLNSLKNEKLDELIFGHAIADADALPSELLAIEKTIDPKHREALNKKLQTSRTVQEKLLNDPDRVGKFLSSESPESFEAALQGFIQSEKIRSLLRQGSLRFKIAPVGDIFNFIRYASALEKKPSEEEWATFFSQAQEMPLGERSVAETRTRVLSLVQKAYENLSAFQGLPDTHLDVDAVQQMEQEFKRPDTAAIMFGTWNHMVTILPAFRERFSGEFFHVNTGSVPNRNLRKRGKADSFFNSHFLKFDPLEEMFLRMRLGERMDEKRIRAFTSLEMFKRLWVSFVNKTAYHWVNEQDKITELQEPVFKAIRHRLLQGAEQDLLLDVFTEARLTYWDNPQIASEEERQILAFYFALKKKGIPFKAQYLFGDERFDKYSKIMDEMNAVRRSDESRMAEIQNKIRNGQYANSGDFASDLRKINWDSVPAVTAAAWLTPCLSSRNFSLVERALIFWQNKNFPFNSDLMRQVVRHVEKSGWRKVEQNSVIYYLLPLVDSPAIEITAQDVQAFRRYEVDVDGTAESLALQILSLAVSRGLTTPGMLEQYRRSTNIFVQIEALKVLGDHPYSRAIEDLIVEDPQKFFKDYERVEKLLKLAEDAVKEGETVYLSLRVMRALLAAYALYPPDFFKGLLNSPLVKFEAEPTFEQLKPAMLATVERWGRIPLEFLEMIDRLRIPLTKEDELFLLAHMEDLPTLTLVMTALKNRNEPVLGRLLGIKNPAAHASKIIDERLNLKELVELSKQADSKFGFYFADLLVKQYHAGLGMTAADSQTQNIRFLDTTLLHFLQEFPQFLEGDTPAVRERLKTLLDFLVHVQEAEGPRVVAGPGHHVILVLHEDQIFRPDPFIQFMGRLEADRIEYFKEGYGMQRYRRDETGKYVEEVKEWDKIKEVKIPVLERLQEAAASGRRTLILFPSHGSSGHELLRSGRPGGFFDSTNPDDPRAISAQELAKALLAPWNKDWIKQNKNRLEIDLSHLTFGPDSCLDAVFQKLLQKTLNEEANKLNLDLKGRLPTLISATSDRMLALVLNFSNKLLALNIDAARGLRISDFIEADHRLRQNATHPQNPTLSIPWEKLLEGKPSPQVEKLIKIFQELNISPPQWIEISSLDVPQPASPSSVPFNERLWALKNIAVDSKLQSIFTFDDSVAFSGSPLLVSRSEARKVAVTYLERVVPLSVEAEYGRLVYIEMVEQVAGRVEDAKRPKIQYRLFDHWNKIQSFEDLERIVRYLEQYPHVQYTLLAASPVAQKVKAKLAKKFGEDWKPPANFRIRILKSPKSVPGWIRRRLSRGQAPTASMDEDTGTLDQIGEHPQFVKILVKELRRADTVIVVAESLDEILKGQLGRHENLTDRHLLETPEAAAILRMRAQQQLRSAA